MIGPTGSHKISADARNALFDRSSIESIVDENRAQSSDILHEELFPLPLPNNCPPRPLNQEETARVDTLSRLQFFLATAPTRWGSPSADSAPSLHKFHLPTGESVSCVLWQGLFHITGTDIVRALAFRFEAFGRPIKSSKKWEEGVFSDLRNLKPGVDAALEEPKSPLLEFLFRNGCIRTQKKQKVFYWFSVPHDRLFLDALERDLKREKAGLEPTSIVVGEPAMSFRYDPKRTLYEQFAGQNPGILSNNASPVVVSVQSITTSQSAGIYSNFSDKSPLHTIITDTHSQMDAQSNHRITGQPLIRVLEDDPRIFKQSILPGSSDYKRRRSGSRRASSVLRALERTSVVRTHPDPVIPRAWTSSPQLLSVVPSLSDRPSTALTPSLPRVYSCMYDDCGKRFKRLEHLKRHIRTHTNERPFVCPTCFRTFTRQDNLVQHFKTHQRSESVLSDNNSSSIIRRRTKQPQSPDLSLRERSYGMDPIQRSDLLLPLSSTTPLIYSSNVHRSLTAPPDQIDHPYGLPPALPIAAQFSLSSDSRLSPALDLMQSQGLQHMTSNMVTVPPLANQYLSNRNVDEGLGGLANPHVVPGSSVPLPSESASEAAFDASSTFTSFS